MSVVHPTARASGRLWRCCGVTVATPHGVASPPRAAQRQRGRTRDAHPRPPRTVGASSSPGPARRRETRRRARRGHTRHGAHTSTSIVVPGTRKGDGRSSRGARPALHVGASGPCQLHPRSVGGASRRAVPYTICVAPTPPTGRSPATRATDAPDPGTGEERRSKGAGTYQYSTVR